MANRQHLALIRQGVDVWNKWREENPTLTPDLRGADLIVGQTSVGQASVGQALVQ
jgi:hypothetical protein